MDDDKTVSAVFGGPGVLLVFGSNNDGLIMAGEPERVTCYGLPASFNANNIWGVNN